MERFADVHWLFGGCYVAIRLCAADLIQFQLVQFFPGRGRPGLRELSLHKMAAAVPV
jgi:hypothetical protein